MPNFDQKPNADGTVDNVEDKTGSTTSLHQSIDETSADDDTTYINNSGRVDGSVFFDLEEMPTDFGGISTISINIRRRAAEAVSFNSEDVTFNGKIVSK